MNVQIGDNESSASGFVVDDYGGVTDGFAQLSRVSASTTHVITRAKRHGRWYALKSLSPDVADQTVYQEMLGKEFEISMRLQHPGVVQTVNIEDVPQLGRCIVMEWIDGMSMKQWLAKSPSRAERRKAFSQLLDAVSYLHDLGIVHRDLKPANIMFTAVGHNVKIIDFSLADTSHHAEFKQPAGTSGYISPEQSSDAKPDVRNDIYSLGIILRQMDLGLRYAHVAEKCLSPIDKRYQSIAGMKTAIKSRSHLGRWVWTVLLIFVSAIVIMAWLLMPHHQETVAPDETTEHTISRHSSDRLETATGIDSVLMGENKKEKIVLPTMGKEKHNTIIPDTSNAMKQPSAEAQPKQRGLVGDAVSDGVNELNFVLYRYTQQHGQDTLSDVKYLKLDYEDMKRVGHAEIDRYIYEIHEQFDEKELAYIRRVLTEECDGYVKWVDELVRSRN